MTQVLVVVCCRWSVENDAAENTVRVLQTEVAVVPACPILSDLEPISHRLPDRNGALSDAWNSVVDVATRLAKTMPVDGGTVRLEVVGNMDDKAVTPVGNYRGAWNRPVDRLTLSSVPVWRTRSFFYRQPVLSRDSRVWCFIVVVCVDGVVPPAVS